MSNKDIEELLNERGKEYGQAWLYAGSIMQYLGYILYMSELFTSSPFAHNWVMILSKMCRLLASPYKVDTWRDIAGYCQLVIDYIEQDSENE